MNLKKKKRCWRQQQQQQQNVIWSTVNWNYRFGLVILLPIIDRLKIEYVSSVIKIEFFITLISCRCG